MRENGCHASSQPKSVVTNGNKWLINVNTNGSTSGW
jgi:hypothetical protein